MNEQELRQRIDADLSDNAKSVGFSFFPTKDSKVTFHMRTHGPSEECQAALDELVSKGFATAEPFNRLGGVVYQPTTSFSHLAKWAFERAMAGHSITLWEPLKQRP